MTELYLDCFEMQKPAPELVPGRSKREWMENSPERFAYRCLPLTMANSTGWELLCPFEMHIEWNGGMAIEDIRVSSPDPRAHVAGFALSHFSSGIVTFHTGHMFRTPPGWAIWCMGPPNEPKDGIYALSGLVETDWLPFPFTMNWKMTRPGKVVFKKGESFCFFTLNQHHKLEEITPKIRNIDSDPALKKDYELWTSSRTDFLKNLADKDPETMKEGWQRHYMQGKSPDGEDGSDDHTTKRRLKFPKRET